MKGVRSLIRDIIEAFPLEKNPADRERKLILAATILQLRLRRKKRFGLFVVFGWENKWNKSYADISDAEQDIFAGKRFNVFTYSKKSFKKIAATIDFDGAILIDRQGDILHSGVILEGLRPRRVANRISPGTARLDLSGRLGFKKKVHTRHLSAIAASYELKGTTVFTVSEETGDVHIFEKGRIIFSTTPGEAIGEEV